MFRIQCNNPVLHDPKVQIEKLKATLKEKKTTIARLEKSLSRALLQLEETRANAGALEEIQELPAKPKKPKGKLQTKKKKKNKKKSKKA